ncbi:MAG: NAD(P)-dependent oxidoreductase [Gammaproteobacteria bacterium]|nr:NAD(P)-dependent oxidoreductase [Gammaproteobacteria bacterium]
MNYLVSGCQSGLGKFLCHELMATGISRTTDLGALASEVNAPYDAIIHCAFNSKINIAASDLAQYMRDNILLTQQLLTIPHQKFIFISTVDVYPPNVTPFAEDEDFFIDDIKNIYGLSKLMSETLVQSSTPDYLILRATAMLGLDARKNSLMKMIFDATPTLSLAPTSRFHYILHEDVLAFIRVALAKDLQGKFNLASSQPVILSEVSHFLQKKIEFGSFHYEVGEVNNTKVQHYCQVFQNTSLDNIRRFINLLRPHYDRQVS